SLNYVVAPKEPYIPNIILRSDCTIKNIRVLIPEEEKLIATVLPDFCTLHHFSYSKRPEEIRKKVNLWGHAHQVPDGWYEKVFEAWVPGTDAENLHPTQP